MATQITVTIILENFNKLQDITDALESVAYTYARDRELEGRTVATPGYNLPFLIETEQI